MKLESKRIFLKPLSEEELNGNYVSWLNDKEVCKFNSHGETEYTNDNDRIESVKIYASDDNGISFYLYSVIPNIDDNDGIVENSICKLNNGRYIFIGRRKGVTRFSEDECKTWSEPYVFGMDIFDPHFIMFPNGVLGCIHGSYKNRALRIILSKDNGMTWNGPDENIGYMIDDTVYGYSHCMLLDDGSAYIVYINNGGHDPHAARTQALWTIRIRPFDNAQGIEILSASGANIKTERFTAKGDDPELGNLKIADQ